MTSAWSSAASTPKRMARGLLSTAIVVGIFVGLMPKIADYTEVWDTIRAMTVPEVTTLLLVGLVNLVTYWFVLTSALPGLRIREAAVLNQASTAVSNTLPAGGAIGLGVTVSMLTSWGFRLPAIGRQAVVTGVWNNLVKLGLPVLALVLLALQGDLTPGRVVSALIGVAVLLGLVTVLAMVLRSERFGRILGRLLGILLNGLRRLVGKEPVTGVDDKTVRFRTDTIDLLTHRWLRLTLSTLVSHFSLFAVLLIALRYVGLTADDLSWITILAAFAFVRLISALPLTPGGVGIVELGFAAVLTIGLNDFRSAQVVAAVLLFRAITYLLPVPLGITSYLVWRGNRSWRMDPSDRDGLIAA